MRARAGRRGPLRHSALHFDYLVEHLDRLGVAERLDFLGPVLAEDLNYLGLGRLVELREDGALGFELSM